MISGVAGYGAAQIIKSPAEVLADTAPPAPALLTAVVERRVLRDVVVVRGRVSAERTVQITPAPKHVERAVLTAILTKPGEELQGGSVLVEVSGRPLIALPGKFPAFRDLLPGMSGRDVTQLQQALSEAGYRVKASGTFDSATKAAVKRLYQAVGYPPAEAGQPNAIEAAEAAVRQAEKVVADAKRALDALLEEDTDPPPGTEEIDAARDRLHAAETELATVRRQRDDLANASGPMLPIAEVIFVPAFPARIEQLNGAVGDDVTDPFLVVSSGKLEVRSDLSPGQRQLLAEGMPVEIASELYGVAVEGSIKAIGQLSVTEAGDRAHLMVVKSASQDMDPQLAGADVRLTVTVARTDNEVLGVPAAAVYTDADGRPSVMRVLANGDQKKVTVTLGASGGGQVAVVAASDNRLREGDRVVVGAAATGAP